LLESYILISRADEGIAQDYDAYRNNHHEQLRQFIREYVINEATGAPASRNMSRRTKSVAQLSRHELIGVAPHPGFARFNRAHQRMLGAIVVLGCVRLLGGIDA